MTELLEFIRGGTAIDIHWPGDKRTFQVKRILKYNLMITLLQFLLFVALLFAVFFIKFNLDKKTPTNSQTGFVIEQTIINLNI
jgi:hypothetical protein